MSQQGKGRTMKKAKQQGRPITEAQKNAKELRKQQNRKYVNTNRQPGKPNLQTLLGERGQDITSPSNTLEALRSSMVVSTMTKVLPIEVSVSIKAVQNMSLGIILHALKHGLAAAAKDATTNPYYMYRYLTDAFMSAMKGTIPAIQQAPVWFWEIIHSIRKKQAPFKLSEVNYSWHFEDSQISDESPIPMGVGDEAYSIVFTTTLLPEDAVLGFPALGFNGTQYTLALGADAIGQLWAYTEGSNAMTTLISDPGEDAYTYRDTSSFAVVYPELGGSFLTPNALKSTIYSERNIDSPLFAKFATYQPEGTELWRGWHKAGASGGSSCAIGPTLSSMTDKEEIRGKVSPIVKFYNFDEFFEVLSLTLASASSAVLGRVGEAPPCPLSPLQAQILLRQTIIPLFSNEKYQDLRMSQQNSQLLLPFSVGQNGVSMGTNMLLPLNLAENLRAAKSFSNRINKKNARSTLRVESLLGRPPGRSQIGNYGIANGSNPPTLLYATGIDNNLVNLIDCSTVQNNSVLYLDFTREQINILAATWNEWITQLSTNLSPLVAIGQTDGIAILKTSTLTNFQEQFAEPLPVTAPPQGASSKKTKIIIPGISRKSLNAAAPISGSSYFVPIIDRFTTSLQIVNAPVWKYLSIWVLPIAISNPNPEEEQSIQGWSSFFIEAYRVPRSTAASQTFSSGPANSTTAYDRHVLMAQVDVKSIATDGQNELIEGLIQMGKEGRGGFLDAIASLVGPAINAFGLL